VEVFSAHVVILQIYQTVNFVIRASPQDSNKKPSKLRLNVNQ
jgi:hypothetical protein